MTKKQAALYATGVSLTVLASVPAYAQDQIQEIVVTAQRREQNLQDVPIAITAITQDALEANRITSVTDLNSMAPNVTVRPSAGAVGIPSFTMRGVTSYGVVPGSDKQVSIYVDGVYIASPRGSTFELPDIARIEVLRGPQGTLFGRNATAGAVSVVTREPDGVAGATQDFTIGNYNQFRTRTTLNLPSWGPLSAYVSFVHNKRDGDIRNLGAGTYWDRTGPDTNVGGQYSPRRLGDKNADNWFVAVKFAPSDNFDMTYKFDHATNHFTPEGTALIAYNPTAPLVGNLLTSLFNSQATPVVFETDGKRPSTVNNSFAVEGRQRNTGHVLTANLHLSDSVSLKNIAAYRKSFITSATQLDGAGGLVLTPQALVPYATFVTFAQNPALANASPTVQAQAVGAAAQALAPAVGSRFCIVCNNSQSAGEQWSDELQLNYSSKILELTVGALYFHQKDRAGGPPGMANNFTYTPLSPTGRLALGNESTTYTKGTSLAAYAQAEIHVLPQVDIIAGARITRDKKSGTYVRGGTYIPGPNGFEDGTFTGQTLVDYTYKKTKPNFSIGVNYKPTDNILVFGKYSTAFVSGGSIGNIPFDPETVASWEGGIKADLFDRHVRTNLALFHAKYKHLQSAQSGSNVGRPDLGTVIIDQGEQTAKGFEFEATILPVEGLTLNGSLGYTDVTFDTTNPILAASVGGTRYVPFGIPKWTSNLAAQYETPPLFGEARMSFRLDATWQSKRRNDANPDRDLSVHPGYAAYAVTDAYWVLNGRVALKQIDFGPGRAEIALWSRNLTNAKEMLFPVNLSGLVSSNFLPARTYGLDLSFSF